MNCDADDYYATSQCFSSLHKSLTEYPCDAVQFGYYKRYKHLSFKAPNVEEDFFMDGTEFQKTQYPKLLCNDWPLSNLRNSVWAKVYRRSLVKNLPDSENVGRVFWGEDIILNLHLLRAVDSFYYLMDRFYCYRQTTGGTHRWSISTMYDLDRFSGYQLAFLQKWHGEEQVKERILATLYSRMTDWLFQQIKEGMLLNCHEEMVNYIAEVMSIPCFVDARKYYEQHEPPIHLSAELLLKADPEEFLKEASSCSAPSQSLKSRIRRTIRQWV